MHHDHSTISISYIGLGSNIEPEQNLRAAAAKLKKAYPNIRFSSVYRSSAQEITNQPDFLNAVAKIETNDSPHTIQNTIREIEQALKKNPPYRFGPRTIDLDILLYDDLILQTPELVIPHPRMHERRFVLEPLMEIYAGDVLHPGFDRKLKQYLSELKQQPCEHANLKSL